MRGGRDLSDPPGRQLADLAAFSFHGRKGITAGEGGAPVSDRDDLIAHARTLHTYDIEPAIVGEGSGELATPELPRAGLQRPARRSKTRPA